ncbi:MAG: hypothetical protein WDZ79_01790 [Candidatus Paceibacterota bacterium]
MPEESPYSKDARRKTGPAPVAPGGVGPKMSNEGFEEDFPRKTPKKRGRESGDGQSSDGRAGTTGGRAPRRSAARGLTRTRAKARQDLRARRQQEQRARKEQTQPPKKKLTGLVFFVILFLALGKDIVDIIVTLTGVGAPVSTVAAVFLTGVVVPYYYMNGVLPTSRKVAMWVITGAIAFIPFLAILPTAVINLILTRTMENNELIRSVASKASVRGNVRRTARRKE